MKVINKILFLVAFPLYVACCLAIILTLIGIVVLGDEMNTGFRKVMSLLE